MPPTAGTTFLRKLRRIVVAQSPSQLADDELLRQFIREQDEASFAALVRRHGPMVLNVCRNVLHHQQDAEDVFQATFLLLARKADTIRKQQALSSWLHGVAYRLALKLRTQKSRRQDRERSAPLPSSTENDDLTVRELRVILHEELNRLPEKYRAPLLLCYWEGKTRDEAAERLGMTGDALKKRLERARSLLGSRLTQRGLVPTVALFTWLISENGARAAVSYLLIQNTVQAAVAFASAETATTASVAAVTLAQGAIRTMFLTKCITALCTVLAVLGVGGALSFFGYQALAGKQPADQQVVALQAKPKPAVQKSDAERIVGTWRVVKGIASGRDMPADFTTYARLTFAKDGKLNMTVGGEPNKKDGEYKLVGAGKIDLLPSAYGIYKFAGDDRLTLCITEGGGEGKRPTEFSSDDGSGQSLFTMERAKPLTAEELAKAKGTGTKLREGAQRAVSSNNLKQIGLAMHNYHDVHKAFPANAIYSQDGKKALLSWRVAILPFIEQEQLYREFKLNEPWDSAHNKKLIAKMPKIYADLKDDPKNEGKTYYQVFTGPKAAFEGNLNKSYPDFVNGTSNTAMGAEAKEAVIWTQPVDIVVPAEKGKMPELGGLFPSGFHVMMADGVVRFVSRAATPAEVRALAIPKE